MTTDAMAAARSPLPGPRALPAPSMLSGWGGPPAPGRELLTEDLAEATRGAVLCRGLGRSYGDSSLPALVSDKIVGTRLANRILSLDVDAAVMRAEAGLSLTELNPILMAHGLFPPVTPGTRYVTLGGMVASDVHGKHHHRSGCFGAHVRSLRMRLADGDLIDCSPTVEPDLFWATVGGMGLTGHILEVEFSLERISGQWLWMDSERVGGIDAFLESLDRYARSSPMTAGWIDGVTRGRSMGRGIMTAGRWATPDEVKGAGLPELPPLVKSITVPFHFPNWVLNPLSTRIYNEARYRRHIPRLQRGVVAPEQFFYPLDALLEWNRVYGSRGFTQHQCVLPRAAGPAAVREFMELLTRIGSASPVCVIKDCGLEGKGILSFPMEGTSIAVDIAISPEIQRTVDRLNEFVIAAGGRIYLTKDRFTRPEHFRAMEPRLPRFLEVRQKWDPHQRLRSAQSVRLFGDNASGAA